MSATAPEILEGLLPIWEQVFDVKPVNPDIDFYALGGHSLLALGIVLSIEENFGTELPISLLLEDSFSPREMSQHLSSILS